MTRPPTRSRTGHEVPADRVAVNVGRGTKWATPFRVRSRSALARVPAAVGQGDWEYEGRSTAAGNYHPYFRPDGTVVGCTVRYTTAAEAVDTFRRALTGDYTPAMWAAAPSGRFLSFTLDDVRRELAGKDLVCSCPPRRACHADVLLEIANADGQS